MVEIDALFQTKTARKKPFGAAHTYTAYIRVYPPGAKNVLQIMSLAVYMRTRIRLFFCTPQDAGVVKDARV